MFKFITLLLFLLPTQTFAVDFSDLQYSHYEPVITQLVEEGVLTGYPDGTFKPRNTVNRAEFLTMLLRDGDKPTPRLSQPCFPDVKRGEWYVPWVCTAENKGLVAGYPDGTFKPTDPVNTVEALKMMVRIMDSSVEAQSGERWFEPYQNFLHDQDILSKYSYRAADNLTRERAADFIAKMRRFVNGKQASRYSTGCGQAAPSKPPTGMVVNGIERTWLIDLPANYVSHKPVPLLFAWHGRTNPNTQVYGYYKFNREAPEFLTVYPLGLPRGNARAWSDGGDSAYQIRDLELFDDMVHLLGNTYCIDLFNVYAAGHSLGGWFSNTLGCMRADVVRATASVGSSGTHATCNGPTAALLMHNPEDRLAPFSSGVVQRDHRLAQNSCLWEFDDTAPQSLLCEVAKQCNDGNEVVWCPHQESTTRNGTYYPHTWPSDASATVIDFFRKKIED
jgi:polyhydroxybutyrate depolymerase